MMSSRGICKECAGGITQTEVQQAAKRLRIGSKLRIRTWKSCDVDSPAIVNGKIREVVVIGKYPRFVRVQLPNGSEDSVVWDDVVKMMREREGKAGCID